MKKKLLFLIIVCSAFTAYGQTYPLFGVNFTTDATNKFVAAVSNTFSAKRFGAITIPVVHRLGGSTQTEVNFLQAGVGGGWVWGRAIPYKSPTGQPVASYRVMYYGFGGLLGAANVVLNKGNDSAPNLPSTPYSDPGFNYGLYFVASDFNLELIIGAGLETAGGSYSSSWINQGVPWIGVGFGFNLYSITL